MELKNALFDFRHNTKRIIRAGSKVQTAANSNAYISLDDRQ
jgi:hypothetical protein